MGQMDFISSIFVNFFFQNYLGKIALITRYIGRGWSIVTACAFYPDSQTVETLRSALYSCAVWSCCLCQKAFQDKQCNF